VGGITLGIIIVGSVIVGGIESGIDWLGREIGNIFHMGKQRSRDKPETLTPEEEQALINKKAGRPYDRKAYNRAIKKQERNQKIEGDRNKEKRGRKN
jgi:hypothetical protein